MAPQPATQLQGPWSNLHLSRQFIGIIGAPVTLIPAPGLGLRIYVMSMVINIVVRGTGGSAYGTVTFGADDLDDTRAIQRFVLGDAVAPVNGYGLAISNVYGVIAADDTQAVTLVPELYSGGGTRTTVSISYQLVMP